MPRRIVRIIKFGRCGHLSRRGSEAAIVENWLAGFSADESAGRANDEEVPRGPSIATGMDL